MDKVTETRALSATTAEGKNPEQVACTGDIKEMLRSALVRAEEGRRAMLEGFTMEHSHSLWFSK